MKNSWKAKKIAISLCIATMLVSASVGVGLNVYSKYSAQAQQEIVYENVSVDVTNLKEIYYKNEILNTQEFVLKYSDIALDTTSELIYPNGQSFSLQEYKLNMIGEYQLVFRAEYLGQQVSKKFTLNIIEKNYELTNSDDTVTLNYEYEGKVGSAISLSDGARMNYNTVIDVSKLTKDDILFEMIPMPSELGVIDYRYFEMTLTDRYDETNYVTIAFNYYDEYRGAYYAAGAFNQSKSGYESEKDRLHIGTDFGAFYSTHLGGTNLSGVKAIKPVQIRFDYAEKAVYVGETTKFVIDLDDSKYFTNLWSGFTTGEVKLSFSAGKYLSSKPAQFLITKIAKSNLNVTEVKDEILPLISVDFGVYEEDNLPKALIGEKYPIFPAAFTDDNGYVTSKVSVYGNYYSNNRYNLQVIDNAFIPNKEGKVYIEYAAKDYSGNEAIKVIPVQAVKEWSELELSTNDSFFEKIYYAGHNIQLPVCIPEGGFGNVEVKAYVSIGNDKVQMDNDLVFVPQKSGAYKVTYIGTDYVGKTKELTRTLNVEISQNPVFQSEPIYMKYLIAGSTYNFASLSAYDYAGDVKTEVKAKLRVIDGQGERILDSLNYKPLESDTMVKVQYIAQTSKGLATTEYVEIPVINVKVGEKTYDLSKYFYGEELETLATENEVVATTTTGFDFINSLLADGFSFEGLLEQNSFNAEYLRLYLLDSLDSSIGFVVDVKMMNGELKLRVNQGVWENVETATQGKLNIAWDNETKKLAYGDFGKATVDKTFDGAPFFGFDSGKLYLSFKFVGATGKSQIKINKINKQVFSTLQYDLQKPIISYSGEIKGTGTYGSRYLIKKAYAADVLDPNISFRMQVTDPNGEYVKDVNGLLLCDVSPNVDYEIDLILYGTYYVQYYAEDASKKQEKNVGYGIIVLDFEEPVLSISGKIVTEGKVGETIHIPNAVAVDNLDGEIKVTKVIVLSSGITKHVKSESFVFKTAGKYVVSYYAYDSSGNFAVYSYTITIS